VSHLTSVTVANAVKHVTHNRVVLTDSACRVENYLNWLA
jgi:hypothetical protein